MKSSPLKRSIDFRRGWRCSKGKVFSMGNSDGSGMGESVLPAPQCFIHSYRQSPDCRLSRLADEQLRRDTSRPTRSPLMMHVKSSASGSVQKSRCV
jgi:hypothetical protein